MQPERNGQLTSQNHTFKTYFSHVKCRAMEKLKIGNKLNMTDKDLETLRALLQTLSSK